MKSTTYRSEFQLARFGEAIHEINAAASGRAVAIYARHQLLLPQ